MWIFSFCFKLDGKALFSEVGAKFICIGHCHIFIDWHIFECASHYHFELVDKYYGRQGSVNKIEINPYDHLYAM